MPTVPATLLVLAGGRSTRLGQDKLWLPIEGQPLVVRVVRRLMPLASEVIVSANHAEAFAPHLDALPLPARCVADQWPDAGPLAGIHAGLTAASHDLVLTVAADLPFVSSALFAHMVRQCATYDAVVPLLPEPTSAALAHEPLHAVYRRSCLPAIAEAIAAGRRRIVSFFTAVRVYDMPPEELRRHDPELQSFVNLNTAQDWAMIRHLLRRDGAGPA